MGGIMNISIERSSLMSTREVPTLSLRDYTDGDQNEQSRFVNQLFLGLKEYGFIILKDHGLDPALLDQAYQSSAHFFAQLEDLKLKYYIEGLGGQRGYTPFGKEHAKDSLLMDLKEFWHVGREVPKGHRYYSQYPANVWPAETPEFRPIFQQIYETLDQAGRILLQALTFPLDVPWHYFDDMVEDGQSILRVLHYPPIPKGVDPGCLRSAPHEDINLITILPAATQAGLQLKDRDGTWLDVNAAPGTLIVDAGDMLSRITNEVIPSTTHQVVNPAGANVSRFSMPFFMHPKPDALLSCIPSCKGKKALYEDITAQEFLTERLRAIGLV